MSKTLTLSSVMLIVLAIVATAGCDDDTRVTKVATEAADRQAKQNEEMVRLNREVAEGTRRLVDADADTRREIIGVHKELQGERTELGQQWNNLEAERRSIAQQRRTESMLVPVAQAVGAVLLVALVIGFCWSLLFGLRTKDESHQDLAELLVQEIVAERPTLLPAGRQHPPAIAGRDDHADQQPRLPHED